MDPSADALDFLAVALTIGTRKGSKWGTTFPRAFRIRRKRIMNDAQQKERIEQ